MSQLLQYCIVLLCQTAMQERWVVVVLLAAPAALVAQSAFGMTDKPSSNDSHLFTRRISLLPKVAIELLLLITIEIVEG